MTDTMTLRPEEATMAQKTQTLCMRYIETQYIADANTLLAHLTQLRFVSTALRLCDYFLSVFGQTHPELLERRAQLLADQDRHAEAYQTYVTLMTQQQMSEASTLRLSNAKLSCLTAAGDDVLRRYAYYNADIVQSVTQQVRTMRRVLPRITCTITTCKRLALFQQTINSFLNCCTDLSLIDSWICVDDNSSDEDRRFMETAYPFFTFYRKDVSNKGHPHSMNLLRRIVRTPYMFHMEDDWLFFEKRNYITDCLEVLGENPKIGQCLVNKNYAELPSECILGGEFNITTPRGIRYYIHEYVDTAEKRARFARRHGDTSISCNYWPHFSFRVSLLRTAVLRDVGEFSPTVAHFEMEYSHRYVAKGYVSAFLDSTYCKHIGRLTSERHDRTKPNAYELNNELQFVSKSTIASTATAVVAAPQPMQQTTPAVAAQAQVSPTSQVSPQSTAITTPASSANPTMRTFVINLDRRPDRWNTFVKNSVVALGEGVGHELSSYSRFSAIDGSQLESTPQLQRIFENNDYNMRRGMVGCALSHLKLACDLINDPDSSVQTYCILEDDATFVQDFARKLALCRNELAKTGDWDLCYLGHHLRPQFVDDIVHSQTEMPKIERFSREFSLQRSMGGTCGYLLSRKGAQRLLDFINRTGMTNGIDTVQQKSANDLRVYYTYPHLVYSPCCNVLPATDSDIQRDYDSLSVSLSQRIRDELMMYTMIVRATSLEDARSRIQQKDAQAAFYYRTSNASEIAVLYQECPGEYRHYTVGSEAIFVVPPKSAEIHATHYFHRCMKNGMYDVTDAIKYHTNNL